MAIVKSNLDAIDFRLADEELYHSITILNSWYAVTNARAKRARLLSVMENPIIGMVSGKVIGEYRPINIKAAAITVIVRHFE